MHNIEASVGKGGVNRQADVNVIQTLLNACVGHLTPHDPLPVTGVCDGLTIEVIEDFQRRVLKSESPDGRIDPGGPTLKALNASASSGPGKKFTSSPNEVPTKNTIPNPGEVVDALKTDWKDLTETGARTLTAQFMHETGGGRYCFNWNLGNVKAGEDKLHMYLKNVWECDSPKEADDQIAKSAGLARFATDEEIREKGWSCPAGKKVVVFQPPHRQCRFRAYPSLTEGVQIWLEHHKKIANKNPNYVTEVNGGNCAGVAKSLKEAGYYTGAEADYAKSMTAQKKKIDAAFAV